MNEIGRTLLVFGLILVAAGLLLLFADKIPFLGRLPGDILVKRKNFTIYFPLATMVLLSIIATVVLNLFSRR
jgi:thiosulfate reductase cytochrome b subunit